jgi:hypothetical protein
MKTYFIEASATGYIKIGRSADPIRRLKNLTTASPSALRLIGVLDHDCEAELHRQYASLRTTGEWFKADGALLTYLKHQFKFRGGRPRLPRCTVATRQTDNAVDVLAMLENWFDAPLLTRPDTNEDDFDWGRFDDMIYGWFLERDPKEVARHCAEDDEEAGDDPDDAETRQDFLNMLQGECDTIWARLQQLAEHHFSQWLGWIEARAHQEHGDLVLVFRAPKGAARTQLVNAILTAGCTVEGCNDGNLFTDKTASAILVDTEAGAILDSISLRCHGVGHVWDRQTQHVCREQDLTP